MMVPIQTPLRSQSLSFGRIEVFTGKYREEWEQYVGCQIKDQDVRKLAWTQHVQQISKDSAIFQDGKYERLYVDYNELPLKGFEDVFSGKVPLPEFLASDHQRSLREGVKQMLPAIMYVTDTDTPDKTYLEKLKTKKIERKKPTQHGVWVELGKILLERLNSPDDWVETSGATHNRLEDSYKTVNFDDSSSSSLPNVPEDKDGDGAPPLVEQLLLMLRRLN